MPHIDLLYPNEYISAGWLRGKDKALTIARVVQEELQTTDGGKEMKVIIYFEEAEAAYKSKQYPHNMRLVCNKTNARQIAKQLGTGITEEWVGQKIVLYPTTCKAFGETVDCVRVKGVKSGR